MLQGTDPAAGVRSVGLAEAVDFEARGDRERGGAGLLGAPARPAGAGSLQGDSIPALRGMSNPGGRACAPGRPLTVIFAFW